MVAVLEGVVVGEMTDAVLLGKKASASFYQFLDELILV
jgi:hypothetical protein